MTIQVACECGRQLTLEDKLAGKRIRCPECQRILQVPVDSRPTDSRPAGSPPPAHSQSRRRRATPIQDSRPRPGLAANRTRRHSATRRRAAKHEEPKPFDIEEHPRSQPSRRTPPRQRKGGSRSNRPLPAWLGVAVIVLCGFGGLYLVAATILETVNQETETGVATAGTEQASSTATTAAATGTASSNQSFDDSSVPPRPAFQVAFPGGVQIGAADYSGGPGPGNSTQLRIYMPAGTHQPQSLGCVLVAPAGTNLLYGSNIDGDDYHDEALPYAEAGYVTIRYSLDGPIDDMESATNGQLSDAYKQFRAAEGGIVNAGMAIRFALARLPEVDASRLYAAGHSSAGTVALITAIRDPRIKACIAYAPCSDVVAFHSGIADEAFVPILFPGMKEFDLASSPMQHAGQLKCPSFLFQADDDSIVDPAETRAFANRVRQTNSAVTLATVPTGNHYNSMIQRGIPAAIAWLKQLETRQ
jgi:dienelactone hydrolase/DNA-directed RNA polymerase subunit RPC12/RpoP